MKRYRMVQGLKARYSLKYYFVWDGLIYRKYKNVEKFAESGFKWDCVDSLKS